MVIYFKERRALATCIGTSGSGAGSFIMPPLLNKLTEVFGWRGAMLIAGGLVLNLCVVAMLFRPLETTHSKYKCKTIASNVNKSGSNEWKEYDENVVEENITSEKESNSQMSFHIQEHKGTTFCDFEIHLTPKLKKIIDYHDDNNHHMNIINESIDVIPSELNTKSSVELSLINHKTSKAQTDARSLSISNYNDITKDRDSVSHKQNFVLGTNNLNFKQHFITLLRTNASVARHRNFVLLSISQILLCTSAFTPVILMVDRATYNGINKDLAVWLHSSYGISSVAGRLLFGLTADKVFTNHLLTYIIVILSSGISTILSPLCGSNFILHAIYAASFGFFMGEEKIVY